MTTMIFTRAGERAPAAFPIPSSRSIAAFLLPLLLCGPLAAQTGNGRIRGTVDDTAKRLVPGARVVLTNEQTGATQATTTTSAGEFTFPQVPLGQYNLKVNMSGFQNFQQNGIKVTADQNLTLPVDLALGSSTETVTVSESGTQVDTQTGTIKSIIDQKSIQDLPLIDRDPRELIALSQGVVETASTFNSNNQSSTIPGAPSFSVNGGRGNSVNFLLDGADNNDPYTNVANPYPDPDALSQFSVQVSNFDSEYGRNSGAIVNAITKSGTNKLHGSIYEFTRNTTFGLDAADWFSAHNAKPIAFLQQHQFGGSIGGPVVIPHLYNGHDKTFFFGSYQRTLTHTASNNVQLTVPNEAQRGGNLSGIPGIAITDPSTGLPFPGNVIPQKQLDAASQQFIKAYLPLPNTASDLNPNLYTFRQPNTADQGQLTLRGDQALPHGNQLALRYFRFDYDQSSLSPQPGNLAYASAGFTGIVHNAVVNLTTVVTPHLVNLASLGYMHEHTHPAAPPAGYPTSQTLGLKVYSVPPNPLYFSIAGWTGATAVYQGLPNTRNNFPFSDTMSYQFRRHSLKFGGQVVRQQQFWEYNQAFPNFSFTGDISGNGLADFLLGYPQNFVEANTQVLNTRFTGWAVFAQDNWKVSDRLSLDLGVRWEPWIPPHFVGRYNQIDVFRPEDVASGQRSAVFPNAPPGLFFAGDRGVPAGGVGATYGNVSPRIGFAYDLTGRQKTVIRGAYGYFIDQPKSINYNRFTNGQPFNFFQQLFNTKTSPYAWEDPYRGGVDPVQQFAEQANNPGKDAQFSSGIQGELAYVNFHMPYVQQWNLTVERQLPLDTLFRVTYAGQKGTHLQWTRDANAPQRQAGPSADWASPDARRPYAPYYSFINGLFWDGYSGYEGIQVSLEHRFSHGLSTVLNYSHARTFDSNSDGQEFIATGTQDPYNLRQEYGPSDFDIPNNFVGSVVYDLPIPSTHNHVADLFVRGWQLNGIVSIHSAQPFSVYSVYDNELNTQNYQRSKLIGDPHLSNSRSEAERVKMYFNPAAYLSTPYTPDDDTNISGRNSLRGPGYRNADISAFKVFNFERAQVQFRVLATNAFNNPSLGINGQSQYPSSAVFGQLSTAKDGRHLQFGVHINF